jgi:hypothetical protein
LGAGNPCPENDPDFDKYIGIGHQNNLSIKEK